MFKAPHKINVEDIPVHMGWHLLALSKTADGTMWKRLFVALGKDSWEVRRRYAEPAYDLDEVLYNGADKAEAVRIYNGLG